jgi:hypothetical protein
LLSSQYSLDVSQTNISDDYQEHCIYDTDGCLLYMQTRQSNLSLFHVSCDSLIIDDRQQLLRQTSKSVKHYTSSTNIPLTSKQCDQRSTMFFLSSSQEHMMSSMNTLQRWQRLDLLNIND